MFVHVLQNATALTSLKSLIITFQYYDTTRLFPIFGQKIVSQCHFIECHKQQITAVSQMIKIFSFLLLVFPFFWTIKAPEASVWDDDPFQFDPGWIEREEKLQCFTAGKKHTKS